MRIFLIGLGEGLARSVARYLSSDRGVALAGVAPSIALAELMLPGTRPTLALVDWSALGASPRHSLQALRRTTPRLRIVCVASEPEAYSSVAAVAGADAVIAYERFATEFEFLLRIFCPGRVSAGGFEESHHD